MRRTPAWAGIALYPVVAIAVGICAPDSWNYAAASAGPAISFLALNWWALICAPAILLLLFFVGHALANAKQLGVQRVFWAVGILLLGPLVAPLYWWFCSEAPQAS